MKLKLTDGRPEDALKTPEAQTSFLLAALEDGDPEFFAHCIGIVARAHKMSGITVKVRHRPTGRRTRTPAKRETARA